MRKLLVDDFLRKNHCFAQSDQNDLALWKIEPLSHPFKGDLQTRSRIFLQSFRTVRQLPDALHQIERFKVLRANSPTKCPIELDFAKSTCERL